MWYVELKRTACVKLAIPDERRDDLKETMFAFREASQMFVDRGWRGDAGGDVITSRSQLQSLVYDDVRDWTDGLHSDLCVGAANHASSMLRSVDELRENGKNPGKPAVTSTTTVYNTNAVSYFDGYCTLAAYGGRIQAEYVYPDGDNPQTRYIGSDEWELKGGTLRYDRETSDYYLHVTVEQERDDELEEAENGTVLGVDLGVNTIAATSTGRMWSAGYLNHRRREYERIRGNLQETGTESAHRTIDGMGERESRWGDDLLHRLSKSIVHEAITHDCSAIAFEDLTDIRERMPGAKKFHAWAFRRLYEYVEYKAKEYGVRTVQKDPAYTSQRCSHCGFTHENNRHGDHFRCQKCEYEVHADYNGAKNIAMKHIRAGQKSPSGGVNRQLALKSGTLNGNGEFSPANADA